VKTLDKTRLAYIDAAATDFGDSRLYVAAGFSGSKLDASRMLLLMSESEWMSHDVRSRIVSVHADPAIPEFFALGRDGFVSIATKVDIKEERIVEAGTGGTKAGYVSQIKVIGGEAYVCGDLHQVYKRTNSGWIRIDEQIRVNNLLAVGQGLNSIDGTGPDDIYTVGDRGLIFHYDGKSWKELNSPTNCSLEQVTCVSRDVVYICGSKGILLRGRLDEWEIIHLGDLGDDDLWDLEWFGNKLYVSTATRVLVITDDQVAQAMLGPERPVQGHHLTSSSSSLWAIAVNQLYQFDGVTWSAVQCPGND
jgi:hypothetical protein